MIRDLFRRYYRSAEIDVPDIGRREFGFLAWGGAMVRHKAFVSVWELREFLAEEGPLGAYCSAALYEDPGNRNMDAKGWLGADLIFDVDGDHIADCEGLGCVEIARVEAARLMRALEEELGLGGEVVFSGHRGFHIHVKDEEVRGLTADERRRLVEFLGAKGLRRPRMSVLAGSLVRAALKDFGMDPAVHVDEVVTTDVHRLIRLPKSLNDKTGLVALPLAPSDLERDAEYIMKRAVAFRGDMEVKLKAPVKSAYWERIDGKEGEAVVVPAWIGVYLTLKRLAEPV